VSQIFWDLTERLYEPEADIKQYLITLVQELNIMSKSKRTILYSILILIGIVIGTFLIIQFIKNQAANRSEFDQIRAYQDVINQTELGARIPGSKAHEEVIDYIRKELTIAGWDVEIQESVALDQPIKNIVARRGQSENWVILGAHYDSRFVADADSDPDKRSQPVIGANDGASGVAVLLEIARTLPKNLDKEIWLVFFDAEDQGNIPGWNWILGSKEFVRTLEGKPDAVVVVDMIGDVDLNIYREKSSNQILVDSIWSVAKELGFENSFFGSEKFNMLDDHTPFLDAGIQAMVIIDFDYPYWHTTEDTADKVSPESLGIVGKTLSAWLLK
jgi:glutaminyl-peptide cyclotransferase